MCFFSCILFDRDDVEKCVPKGFSVLVAVGGGCRSFHNQDVVAAVVQSVRESICSGKSTLAAYAAGW